MFRRSFVPDDAYVSIFHPKAAKEIASAPYKLDSILYYVIIKYKTISSKEVLR